jgi:hypothetical protein
LVTPQPSELGEGGESPLRCIYSMKHIFIVLAFLWSCSDNTQKEVCVKTVTEWQEIDGVLVEVSECDEWAKETDSK